MQNAVENVTMRLFTKIKIIIRIIMKTEAMTTKGIHQMPPEDLDRL